MEIILKIFLDLEATQFSKEIISIGAISSNSDKEFYSLIKSKSKITKLITDITGITNELLKNSEKFEKVFNKFWDWCMSQKESRYESIYFYTYGNFDKELFLSESKRRPNDKRLKFICNNIIDIQNILMMSLQGEVRECLSLLNATKLFTNRDDLEQDHNSLNDAKLLKLLYKNIGQPNIDNLILAEKRKYVKQIKKLFGMKELKNKPLKVYLNKKESLENLTFEEITQFENIKTLKEIEKIIKRNYWLLSEEYYYDSILDRINKKED